MSGGRESLSLALRWLAAPSAAKFGRESWVGGVSGRCWLMELVEGVKSPDACRSSKDTAVSFVVQQLTFVHFSAATFLASSS